MLLVEHRHIDHWNRIEKPEIEPHQYAKLMFDQGVKAIQWQEDIFSTNHAGAIAIHRQKK